MITDIINGTTADPYEGLSVLDIKRLEYPLWAHRAVGVFLFFVGFFGFFENILVLLTFAKNKAIRSSTNVFIMGLSISDFLMATLCNPLAWTSAMNGKWFAGEFWCYWEGFLVYALGLAALYLLTAVSVDRYIVIAKPLLSPLITKRVAVLAVLSCYFAGAFWAIFPFFGWSSYGLEAPGVFCGLHYEDKSFSNTSYVVTIFLFCFLIPLVVMIYCYFNVYMTVVNVGRNSVWDMKSRVARKNLRIEKRMLKSCIIMCTVYWVCWTPYAVVSFWQAFGDENTIPLALTALPAAAAKSQVMWNPIIYVATNKQFRKAFYSILPCSEIRTALQKKEDEEKERSSQETNVDTKKEVPEPSTTVAVTTINPTAVAPTQGEPTKVEC